MTGVDSGMDWKKLLGLIKTPALIPDRYEMGLLNAGAVFAGLCKMTITKPPK